MIYGRYRYYHVPSIDLCLPLQGRAQEFERGGGRNLKPSVFRPKSSEEQKKKVNTSADVQFLRFQIVLYTCITFTLRKFCAFVCEKGGGRLQRPPPFGYALAFMWNLCRGEPPS